MKRILPACFVICALFNSGQTVSSKMDFGSEEASAVANTTRGDDEDVEVKHTIVVSTKLKNNNRRGIIGRGEGDAGVLSYNIGAANRHRDDSGEVPVIKGYKAVETTEIRTPDTRYKTKIYPDAVFVNRNIRDEYDVFPNVAFNPTQWKPSSFFNNIHWRQPEGRESIERRNHRPGNQGNLNRKITDDAMKEFYCKKCREYSAGQGKGCTQQRSPWSYETTTQKMKLDGKLAKLN